MENLLQYLEKAAERAPDKKAVEYRDDYYDYKTLMRNARAAASAVLACGEGSGRAIGVIAERAIETPAFFFAALYSGNFYVPLDPDLPEDKLRAIVEESGMDIILGTDDKEERLRGAGYTGRFLTQSCFDFDIAPTPAVKSSDPAYMVYTSGSTGKPKGVLKSHGAVISFVEAYTRDFDFGADEVIGNQTPFFFDASAKDIYLALKLAAELQILPTALFSLPPELIDYLNEKKVTFASWVPTAISIVAQLNPFSMVKPQTLRKLFFVGEVMPMKHLNKWREALPGIDYVNLYGQSELAGICCWYRVRGEFDNSATLPMGRPLSNSKIYLLDGDRVITEADKEGEIYIVSDALAMEYYNDPAKTAECFPRRDFGEGEVRCFKTGDFAKRDAEGNLIFVSRRDNQIKHMGHRIELGEIEAVAGGLAEISRCCCCYDAQRSKIIMFCELSAGSALKPIDIRRELKARLVPYMLPGKVVILDKLPLNKNGKIDRQGLKSYIN